MQSTSPERFYSVNEARRLLGIGNTTLFALIKNCQLSARKIGSRTVIAESEIARYQASLPVLGRKGDA